MISDEGVLVQNLGEKELVCLIPTNSFIFCGGFNKKLVILSATENAISIKEWLLFSICINFSNCSSIQ